VCECVCVCVWAWRERTWVSAGPAIWCACSPATVCMQPCHMVHMQPCHGAHAALPRRACSCAQPPTPYPEQELEAGHVAQCGARTACMQCCTLSVYKNMYWWFTSTSSYTERLMALTLTTLSYKGQDRWVGGGVPGSKQQSEVEISMEG